MLRVVLVWINGPFGGGKTHTADEIQRRLAGSIICDPEHLGYGLHRMTPPHLRGDFQDFRTWRKGTLEVLEFVLDRHEGHVIVPVTIIEPAYLAEILGPLREKGHQVRHYALLAERATILRRIRGRSLPWRPDTWAEGKIDECLDRLGHDDFAEHIRTDDLTIAQTAERIAASAGLTLTPDGSNFLSARARRTWGQSSTPGRSRASQPASYASF
jgi:hypothetical protein